MRPYLNLTNPLYREPPFDDPTVIERFKTAIIELADILRLNDNSHSLGCDDMILWFRNLGFLSDQRFNEACRGFESSGYVRAKLYRIYIYCWALDQALTTGCYACDLGTYDAKTVQIADRYTNHAAIWYLYDAFTTHPSQPAKEKHGERLISEVKERVKGATVTPGLLPQSLIDMPSLSFLHVDLNDAEAESQCLQQLFPAMRTGGIVLLDDYGWSKYADSYKAHKAFFESYGQNILELPTGQGIIIKR